MRILYFLTLSIFIIFQSVILVNSVGLYDDYDEFVFYTNNQNPKINISIENAIEELEIKKRILTINSEENETEINEKVLIGTNYNYLETLNKNFKQTDQIDFKLFVISNYTKKEAKIKGDPTSFKIIYDNSTPIVTNPKTEIFLDSNIDEISFSFNEAIFSYSLKVNNINKFTSDNSFPYIRNYNKQISFKDETLNFASLFNEGINNVELIFEDFAGNKGSLSFKVVYRGPDLEINLLTLRDDSSLKYFYDKNYPNFFNKTIYTKEENFKLSVTTSKEATCYFTQNFDSFRYFENIPASAFNEKIVLPFTTSNNLKHEISVDSKKEKFWVGCENINFPRGSLDEDIVYLSKEMFSSYDLINVKIDDGRKLEFEEIVPGNLITNTPFNFYIRTNKRSICLYQVNNLNGELSEGAAQSNYLDHYKESPISNDGRYNLNFNCFDSVYNLISENINLKVDSTLGIKVTSFSPKYTADENIEISLSLSDDQDECVVSRNNISQSNFDSFPKLTIEKVLLRSFNSGPFIRGNNNFNIGCKVEGILYPDSINIIYDNLPPTISDVKFLNNGILSDYLNSFNEMNLEIIVSEDSYIPMKQYTLEFGEGNETTSINISSNKISLSNLNLSSGMKIKVYGINEIDVKSNIFEKELEFDLEKPLINFNYNGNSVKISCYDEDTDCSKILYGLSKTNIDCIASLNYTFDDFIEFNTENYICVKAYDLAGNIAEEITSLESGFSFTNITFDDPVDDDTGEPKEDPKEPDEVDPFEKESFKVPEDSSSNYVIIAAITLLIVSVSSGSYYAYKKGYLNEQLKKMGIKVPEPNTTSNGTVSDKLRGISEGITNKFKRKSKKTSYEDHLKKLNRFVDNKISGSSQVFDKFKTDTHKGKVDGYEDTLIKGKTSTISKEDVENKLNNTFGNGKYDDNSVEKEAENFEKYYKSKKTSKDKK